MDETEIQSRIDAVEERIDAVKARRDGAFDKLKAKLAKKGNVSDPAALAAWIGRKKLGNAAFQKRAEEGKK
jgi:hypothetical protein